MLYLEDYLEMIEHLPQELRDRFTEMREMDLQVQNASDSLEERVKTLFSNSKRMTQADRDAKFAEIKRDYNKVLEDADEKVNQANQLYDLVDRYLRKLDTELHKFKMELEADNRGITEILEKRSLELDLPNGSSHSQKENRAVASVSRRNEKEREREKRLPAGGMTSRHGSTASLSTHDSGWYGPTSSAGNVTPHVPPAASMTPANSSSNLASMASGVNAIAAAASQAIAATQQMQLGRRSASMKASYEALHLGQSTDLGLLGHASGNVPPEVLSTPVATPTPVAAASTKRQKRKRDSVPAPTAEPAAASSSADHSTREAGETEEWGVEGEWVPDPNEPRYCLCNQVSYGDMVACDNPDCPYEWFHYPCVGITAPPKGKWYCPQCASTMKRRGRK